MQACFLPCWLAFMWNNMSTGVRNQLSERSQCAQANEMFRGGEIGYMDIFKVIEKTMEAHKADLNMAPSLEQIVEVDVWARKFAKENAKAAVVL